MQKGADFFLSATRFSGLQWKSHPVASFTRSPIARCKSAAACCTAEKSKRYSLLECGVATMCVIPSAIAISAMASDSSTDFAPSSAQCAHDLRYSQQEHQRRKNPPHLG